jgi:hypothetical protein
VSYAALACEAAPPTAFLSSDLFESFPSALQIVRIFQSGSSDSDAFKMNTKHGTSKKADLNHCMRRILLED